MTVLGLAILMSRRLAAPLGSIARTARAVAAGDLDARADTNVPGEFNEVAIELNSMLDARRHSESQLRESERRYVDLLGNVQLLSLMLDRDGLVTYCNDHLLALVGRAREDVLAKRWRDRFVPDDVVDAPQSIDPWTAGDQTPRHFEGWLVIASGARRLIRWHTSVLRSANGRGVGVAAIGEDVTEARDAEAREKRQREFYKALSRTNGAIVRMTTPERLYAEICAICVEHGHASIAYVSLVESDAVRPVAWAGPARPFLDGFHVTLDDSVPEGRGPTAVAVRTAARYIANDYEADESTLPWRDRAAAIGTKSAGAFPFRRGERVAGTLSLHMTVPQFFDHRLIDLIEEMTGDVSFALDNLDRDAARRHAERLAEAERQRFRTLFEVAPVSITISSADDQRLLDVNEARCAMSGKTREELLGQNAFEAGNWSDPSVRDDFITRLRSDGRVRNFEFSAEQAAGDARTYLIQSDMVTFDSAPCVLTIANDITDLRTAQSKLDERERQLSGLIETAMDAFISVGIDQRVQVFNQAASQMFGISKDEAIGQHLQRFLPERLRAAHSGHVQRFAQTGSTARRMGAVHSLVGLRANGEEFPIEASISKLNEGPKALLTVVIRDASEMRRAEQARVAQAQAESASLAKSEFLSRMSHELRTPLNAVLGFSQLLQSHPTEALTQTQYTQVEQIRKAGWHLLALINDVLDVTKIEAGRIEVVERSVDVHEVLDETYRLTEGMADTRGVRLMPDYRQHEPCRIRADPVRLRQVLINIVSNAIKYNRTDGQVWMNVTREPVSTHIDIVDTGMGMTPDQLSHLYEPFNRLGRSRGAIEGTGLGLTLTRQLVELMKGRIDVSSTPDRGTHVRVSFPSSRSPPQSTSTTSPKTTLAAAFEGSGPIGLVLYIEDNPINVLLVQQLLSRWPGITLHEADSGAAGIAIARTVQPDLTLLDMRLPDMDGVAVLEALRADESTRALRVVALSASAMPDEVLLATRAGAAEYWTKPIDFEQFVGGMRRLLPTGANVD